MVAKVILEFLKIPPDEKLNGLSGNVFRKSLMLSAGLFLILWPIVGVEVSSEVAAGIAFLVMLSIEIILSTARIAENSKPDYLVRLLGFIVFVILIPLSAISECWSSFSRSESLTVARIGMNLSSVLVMPSILNFSLFFVRAMRRN